MSAHLSPQLSNMEWILFRRLLSIIAGEIECPAMMKTSTLNESIGQAIRYRRRELKLSVSELSSIADVPATTIIQLEWHMLDDIDILSVDALCDALSINLPALLERAVSLHLTAIQA